MENNKGIKSVYKPAKIERKTLIKLKKYLADTYQKTKTIMQTQDFITEAVEEKLKNSQIN